MQMKVDEPLVKDEPQETYSEADETKDSLQDSDPSLNYSQHTSSLVGGEAGAGAGAGSGGTGSYTAQPLRPTNQPQTLEELVALPGASGLQGVSVLCASIRSFNTLLYSHLIYRYISHTLRLGYIPGTVIMKQNNCNKIEVQRNS